jgi:hypothetical protein
MYLRDVSNELTGSMNRMTRVCFRGSLFLVRFPQTIGRHPIESKALGGLVILLDDERGGSNKGVQEN